MARIAKSGKVIRYFGSIPSNDPVPFAWLVAKPVSWVPGPT